MSLRLHPKKQSLETASLKEATLNLIASHKNILLNPPQEDLVKKAVERKEALISEFGSLATWNPASETGRIPKDTYIVRDEVTEKTCDWSFNVCIGMDPETFDSLYQDALEVLDKKQEVFVTNRVVGAESSYALPVKVVTDDALTALFTYNMFRAIPEDIQESIFADEGFTLIAIPKDKIDKEKYEGVLRDESDMVVVADFERKLGIVYGVSYLGCVKKMLFTVMNYLLPEKGILPLHCSANEDKTGKSALFLGLSGTGKTTLSNDDNRPMIGDDEHGWSDLGVANYENGCYAKLIHLSPEKEPEIFKAVFTERPYLENRVIVENAMVYPDGSFDLNDDRFTENSRVSYPLMFLTNIKEGSCGDHPETIIFLTADANGVLPPVAKLTTEQAMLWFLMGYTSKLAGTEAGITTPVSAFSRFFGGPFMMRNPGDYTALLQKKLGERDCDVYLVNTGWTGGSYGVGERFDIMVSRAVINAALNGDIKDVPYEEDKRFHILVPQECPGVETDLLNPKNTWEDPVAYEETADRIAGEFSAFYDKNFEGLGLDPSVASCCPGK